MRARSVLRSHSESVTLEFERDITLEQAREVLASAPGVKLVDDLAAESAHDRWPMPLDTTDQDLIWVGRVRRDISNPDALRGITFWCCGDQIRKERCHQCRPDRQAPVRIGTCVAVGYGCFARS